MNKPVPTTQRDAVRATFSPEVQALYRAWMNALDNQFCAEQAEGRARTVAIDAKHDADEAFNAFRATEQGRNFWQAVAADMADGKAATA